MYNVLQPLNICLSYSTTIDTVDALSDNHDQVVKNCRDSLVKRFLVASVSPALATTVLGHVQVHKLVN